MLEILAVLEALTELVILAAEVTRVVGALLGVAAAAMGDELDDEAADTVAVERVLGAPLMR